MKSDDVGSILKSKKGKKWRVNVTSSSSQASPPSFDQMTGVFRHSKYRIAKRGKYVGQYVALDEDDDQGEGADDVEMGEAGD